jgi:hypothetical protein
MRKPIRNFLQAFNIDRKLYSTQIFFSHIFIIDRRRENSAVIAICYGLDRGVGVPVPVV